MTAHHLQSSATDETSSLAGIPVDGPDALKFLQGYVTANLSDFTAASSLPMALPDLHGRVIANGWVLQRSDSLILVIHPSLVDTVQTHLGKFIRFSSCILGQVEPIWVSLSTPSEKSCLPPLPCRVADGRVEGSKGLFRRLRIDLGVVIVDSHTSGKFLPQMIGLVEWGAVNFTKGCYLGQEVISRAQHRGSVKRRLRKFSVVRGEPCDGQVLTDEQGRKGIAMCSNAETAWAVVSGSPKNLRGVDTELVAERTEPSSQSLLAAAPKT